MQGNTIKISTWNVNSIRQRIDLLKKHVLDDQVDILLLQELKCQEHQFPYQELQDLNMYYAIKGQKSYNGVAILSKYKISNIINNFNTLSIEEARYIEATVNINAKNLHIASIYVPNGREIDSDPFKQKLLFLTQLKEYISNKKDDLLILGGDYNVAPEEIDVYDPIKLKNKIGFHIKERQCMRAILNSGIYDAFRIHNPDTQEFSWWDYRSAGWAKNYGMRIDNMLLSTGALDRLKNCYVNKELRSMEKPSDHTPIVCEIDIT
ncbi:MAG: exodeoxyribonuclease III [Candidatus Xenolissoclinum pacificiensis L6]|uniref:Exodeoxyribonuclease III n=1 Tax=Candidatus Xenolissoclinum pacificiensis L6 TaxID=1401685 RepID=W2UZ29_9RICK|nr:MAG: exodeoxyribonuclease III [Candidatus Xenolissoclinum pacificiensis L6]